MRKCIYLLLFNENCLTAIFIKEKKKKHLVAWVFANAHRRWFDLANARLLGDRTNFCNVSERVEELLRGGLEHGRLRWHHKLKVRVGSVAHVASQVIAIHLSIVKAKCQVHETPKQSLVTTDSFAPHQREHRTGHHTNPRDVLATVSLAARLFVADRWDNETRFVWHAKPPTLTQTRRDCPDSCGCKPSMPLPLLLWSSFRIFSCVRAACANRNFCLASRQQRESMREREMSATETEVWIQLFLD